MVSLPGTGETISGFTVTELGFIHMLGARTVEFYHAHSGARLLYIQNDDPELGFNLIYRTPQFDGTDTNHILEHLLLSSCRKYPSRDIFFDMDNKSYSTFMNGLTDNTYTCYPICTLSQEQLIKLVDVYLCCMEEPDALKEKNFFLREALRLELEEPDGPLSMQGTVLSEDWGHLTDIQENADSFTAKALYPGLPASNLLGRLHLHYRELSFELVREAFNRCYDYSNCLMVLYGDADYRSVLEFLDKEHLSRYKGTHRSLLPVMNQAPAPGKRCLTAKSPAYADSPREQASIIDYAIDLTGSSQEELIYWDLFTDVLDSDTSPWHRCAREAGINNVMEVYLDLLLPAPSLRFRLRNGDEEQKDGFCRIIRYALQEISANGVTPELYQAAMKENRLSDALTREGSHLGFNISEEIGRYWSQTGKTDYFQLYETASRRFAHDNSQSILKMLASQALAPVTSAVVVTSPCPGMAEELEEEKEQYLKETLASMSMDERQRLCKDTAAFRQWNSMDWGNMDFLIHPKDLPSPAPGAPFRKKEFGTMTSYTAPAGVDAVGSYQIYFDLSLIPQEELKFLSLYQMLLTELDTGRYTVEQQKTLEQEYLHDCTFDELYLDSAAGADSRPMMTVFWYGLTADFGESLDFLLDIMGGGEYDDIPTILRTLEKYLPDYDLSRADMASSLSFSLAEGYIRQECRFRNLLNSQDVYYFLKDVAKKLREEPESAKEITDTLRRIAAAILSGSRLTFMASANPDVLGDVEQEAIRQLGNIGGSQGTMRQMGVLGRKQDAIWQLDVLGRKQDARQADGASGADSGAASGTANGAASGTANGAASRIARGTACRDSSLGAQVRYPSFILPPQKQKLAICVDAPAQETRMMGDFRSNAGFKGRYLPFLMACADKYLKPAIRYQGGAYDSGIDFYIPAGYFTLWSTADPEVRSTLELFSNTGKALLDISLTQQDLDGYILSAYAQALPPAGTLNNRMRYMRRAMAGIDTEQINLMIADIKNARLEHQYEASQIIHDLLEQGPIVTVGNERAIQKSAGCFDEIIVYRP